MRRFLIFCCAGLFAETGLAASPVPVVGGLTNPECVAVASDGRTFVTFSGIAGTDGDGGVALVKDGVAEPFAKGFDDPKGVAAFQQWLFVADKTRVRRVNLKTGQADVVADEKDFPVRPAALRGVVAAENGTVYVCDAGEPGHTSAAVYSLDTKPKTVAVRLVTDAKRSPALKAPAALALDSSSQLFVLDAATGDLNRVRATDGTVEKVAGGFDGGDGLALDSFGRLFVTSRTGGTLWGIPRPGEKPVVVAEGLGSAGGPSPDATGGRLLIPDAKAGTVVAVPAQIPGWEIDETPLPLTTAVAFPGLTWTGWDNGADTGRVVAHRPILVTHAGDRSDRVFVATQHGVVHIVPNDPKAAETKVFLDIQAKTFYADNENEQGLLGLAFHPRFKENGDFFVFYTIKGEKRTNVLSRFRVSKDDPNKADPASEEELFRVSHKFWNHDGGTVCFGPDGYLYVALGDGGSGFDPDDNAQNLSLVLGKILRIDVDRKADGKPYAVPKDNPFVTTPNARPEIFAYGVRNPWRVSFDRKTGRGWMADVGQNIWEEIDLLVPGGNYGWRRREGLHPLEAEKAAAGAGYIDPVWEYHHRVGKSITGGFVYRGKQFPELDGHYLYADYVTGKVWALKYDDAAKRVVANRPIQPHRMAAIMSFGEDEQGEAYLMTYDVNGKGVFRLVRADIGEKK